MGDEFYDPIHCVEITKSFLVASTLVTQGLYSTVMGGATPSRFKGYDLPVERITWFDAVKFCNLLSEMLKIQPVYSIVGDKVEWGRGRQGFRLLTEAEWEYTCRVGTIGMFACGDLETDLKGMAWYFGNSAKETHSVKSREPNNWGLFDMHGNVSEWIWDYYRDYSTDFVRNPECSDGEKRVVRGGSWTDNACSCSSAVRIAEVPGALGSHIGFRISRSAIIGS